MNSIVIPVYKNEENIPYLLAALEKLNSCIDKLEVVFVVDGSPDNSAQLLKNSLSSCGFFSQLLLLSRNFGSFAAIRVGLEAAKGECFAVMAADLQEPPELIQQFFSILQTETDVDIVIAVRKKRSDPMMSRLASSLFWLCYRKMVMPEMPPGGVDIFGCNKIFRDNLLLLEESHSSLVGLVFWMGFTRKMVEYERQPRLHGKSTWTLAKKWNYLKDSIFSFTDRPVQFLSWIGLAGALISGCMGICVFIAKLLGWIQTPGYSATILTIIFFGTLNILGLGIVGTYAWRTYENTKKRPLSLVMRQTQFAPKKVKK